MDIEQHQKILSECHARYEQQLTAKDLLLMRLKEDFEWYKSRSRENRFNYRRAVLSIAAIDKEIGKK